MIRKIIEPIRTIGPLFESSFYKDVKDPCIVYDGHLWHLYGSGGTVIGETWGVLHASAPEIEGPWTELGPVALIGVSGPHVAAPGVVFDPSEGYFHMAVQQDFMALGGTVEYLVSENGQSFERVATILEPLPDSGEAGLYDPHFSIINGKKYLAYAAMPGEVKRSVPFIPQPDIYAARSTTGLWVGPWERIGRVLSHDDIAWHHNRLGHPDYEWGIEGPQLIELPDGRILLNATCFLEEGRRGTRQRVFFALSKDRGAIAGPYESLGPIVAKPAGGWDSGENGHATAYAKEDDLYLFYQGRSQSDPNPVNNNWRYGIAVFSIRQLLDIRD